MTSFPNSPRLMKGALVGIDVFNPARLFTERALPPRLAQGGEIAQLDGGSFEVKPGGQAEVVKNQVANAVYGGLKR